VRLPIHYEVRPNLQVQSHVTLTRTGTEAAPEVTLPVIVPPEAEAVTMLPATGGPQGAIDLTFDGSALHVRTRQVRAGTYSSTVSLQSARDARYSRSVTIQYTVLPPPGGEQPLSVTNPALNTLWIRQGDQSVQRLTVVRPTWTDAWAPPQIVNDADHMLRLVDLGGDRYDVTIDTAGLALGSHVGAVQFSAGATGGTVLAGFSVYVSASFYLDGSFGGTLTATSTSPDLNWSSAVRMFDGSTAHWTAVSTSPYLHVLRGSGQTDVDALQMALDPAALALPERQLALGVQVSVDQIGVLPQIFNVSVDNEIPTVRRLAPATLVGGAGRVYVDGALRQFGTQLLEANRLKVTGATLDKAQILSDPRFVGDLSILALDISGATPGTPVVIGVDSALLPTQVTMQNLSRLSATAGYQALPFAAYRPGQFAPGLSALYFSAPGAAYRWFYDGAVWSLSQASVPGLIDVAPAPDDTSLLAIDGGHVLALDPVTLVPQSGGALHSEFFPTMQFDSAASSRMRALVFGADGRALASVSDTLSPGSRGVEWICNRQGEPTNAALAASPEPCDPGSQFISIASAAVGAGLVRSANGHYTVGVGPGGERMAYLPAQRVWVGDTKLPSGLAYASVSDSGSRVVRSDGMLLDASDTPLGNLGSVVPFTHIVGGYGLSSGGRFGFVYGYRLLGTGSAQRAVDGTLWVVDLENAANGGVASAPVLAAVALPQAVGCTDALAPGETCEHNASITIAPGDGTAFVLGPRGVAAVPLPAVVSSAAVTVRSKANVSTAQPPRLTRSPLRGAVVPSPSR
jgi:hypothetical protein